MRLSEILGRDVSLEWHEAVAVVRGVVERLLESSSEAIAVPELNQIEISPLGKVMVSAGANSGEPVRRLGQLLQAMLGRTKVPVQLRLFIGQATAPAPAPFGSIRECDDALAYFERPGRDVVLQVLYARAAAAPVRTDSCGASTLDSIAPLPPSARPENSRKDARKSQRHRRQLVAGALLFLGCVGGMQYARFGGIVPHKRNVSAIALKASNAVGDAMVLGLSAVTERAGLGRLVSADTVDLNPSPASVGPSAKGSRAKPSTAVMNPMVAPFKVFDVDPFPSVPAMTSAAQNPTLMPKDVEPAGAIEEELPIYSAESEAVSPPVAAGLQLPRELPSNATAHHPSRIDLIISPAGTVESVKLVGTPHNVHDSMFLSAVKAWTFQPALKNGRPVRYRKTVWVAMQ